MRKEWGCTYFKLDALYWGALRQGHFHDPHATRIEAYRHGMAAILRGAGEAFVLGCHQPIWPSLGLLDGARTSGDISRNWKSISQCGRENLLRGWQNGRLWWNDPDCALLTSDFTRNVEGTSKVASEPLSKEVMFHATIVHATGGMMLSGDDMTRLSTERIAVLRKLIPPTGLAASFANSNLTVGQTVTPTGHYLYVFNWGDTPAERVVQLPGKVRLKDYWTGKLLGEWEGEYRIASLAPRTALLLGAIPVEQSRSTEPTVPLRAPKLGHDR